MTSSPSMVVKKSNFFNSQTKMQKSASSSSISPPKNVLNPKSKDSLDLAAIKNQLPSATGQTLTTTNSSKNLSHVPCKFFKQGSCQAGPSCPFSHNLDGTLAADKLPCKYFQKGNCKFGLKCALAHYLPDGTRINSRSYRNSNCLTITSQANTIQPSCHDPSLLDDYRGMNMNMNISINGNGLNGNITNSISNNTNGTPSTSRFLSSSHGSKYDTLQPTIATPVLTTTSLSTPFSRYSPFSSFVASPPGSVPASSTFSRNQTSASSISSSGQHYIPDEAILNESFIQKDDEIDDFEDYVPGSLGDLILTPQELQRRDSRSQSGTLLVRPFLGQYSDDKHDDVFLME